MKAVIQRVNKAVISVSNTVVSEIGAGLVVYLGIEKGDTVKETEYFAKKIAHMRIFEDENGKMHYSVLDLSRDILLVSQFTLMGNTKRGNRPDFLLAEEPVRANALFEMTKDKLTEYGAIVKTGVFGADMNILQENDGPVTIIMP